MSVVKMVPARLEELRASAQRLQASTGAESFADWQPRELETPFSDDVIDDFWVRQAQPLALYERTDNFVHRLTKEPDRRTTATVVRTTYGQEGSSIPLPWESWWKDIGDLSPFNPRLAELLDMARTLPAIPPNDPFVRGVFLKLQPGARAGDVPTLSLEDRRLGLMVDDGHGGLKRTEFTLQGPSDALISARPFMHRDAAPPDAMLTRTNDLLLAVRDRNGVTTNLPATQRIAITSDGAVRG